MKSYFCWFLVLLGLAGCVDKYEHSPRLAADKAEEFAREAFVKKNYDAAYNLLADGTRRHVSAEQFRQTLTKNQSEPAPRKITATEYEPMPGEKAVYIYLEGDQGGAASNYRITMEGTAATGYKVLRFDRGSGFNLPGSERKRVPQ